MITIRQSHERGEADHGWLQAKHSFSFGGYFDPEHVQFRSLRVLNEDRVAPENGFGMHSHNNMEILTWILQGTLHHKDSMGYEGDITPGQIQRISAGTGIYHSEVNPSEKDEVHLLQIWLVPDKKGHEPSYDQKTIAEENRKNALALIAAPLESAREDVVLIHQDAYLYVSDLSKDGIVEHRFETGRHGWVQVSKGSVTLNGTKLNQGDAAMISNEERIAVTGNEPAQVLLFDLA